MILLIISKGFQKKSTWPKITFLQVSIEWVAKNINFDPNLFNY
jgi:hypothetical protein